MGDRQILIVIPAYNESGRVGKVVDDVRAHLLDADILVIDDGSADGTAAEARRHGAWVASLPINTGYGAALQTGFKFAVRHRYDIVGQIDADGQHQARYLSGMLNALDTEGVDVVIGSRFMDADGHYKPSAARKIGIGLFSRMATIIARSHFTDPTSGLQVLRRSVAEFFCTDVYPSDYPDADILILLHRSGFRTCEVPVQMRPSPGQSMHSGHRSLYYVYKMLLSVFVSVLRPRTGGSR